MPKKVPELSALAVKRLDHPGHDHNATFAVGGVSGLLLQVTPTGARSWILRTKIGAKRRHIGLGPYPDITLAEARERARKAKAEIWEGVDPIERKKAATAALAASQKRGLTFADAVERFLDVKLHEFRNEKHRKLFRSSLDMYAKPALGDMLVSDIRVSDIQRALQPIWMEKTDTARRLRGRIENVLAWATVAGHREGDNPARWRHNLDALLPKPGKVAKTTNQPAVALNDASEWFADVRKREGNSARALEFLALTAARSGEVRGATWNEIDLKARLWTIPALRMKAERDHRVPLADDVLVLLEALPHFEGNPLVFPAPRGGQLSDMALSAVMRKINAAREEPYRDPRSGRPAVPHGLRSTFRDWAAEAGHPREMAEIALAHNVGTEVERAYRRSDMLERRRAMMAEWARFLRGERVEKVIAMRGQNYVG